MELLSERYGWTPEQIRAQPIDDIEAYVEIIRIKRDIERKHLKQHGAKRT
jgi:hypothetical protein